MGKKTEGTSGPRPVLAGLVGSSDKRYLISSKGLPGGLRKEDIKINEDLTSTQRDRLKDPWDDGQVAYYRGQKLVSRRRKQPSQRATETTDDNSRLDSTAEAPGVEAPSDDDDVPTLFPAPLLGPTPADLRRRQQLQRTEKGRELEERYWSETRHPSAVPAGSGTGRGGAAMVWAAAAAAYRRRWTPCRHRQCYQRHHAL